MYEEKSLGVFRDGDESLHEEEISLSGNRATVWSRYLAMHARKQLSFGEHFLYSSLNTCLLWSGYSDMWWLGLALFLVCIIEVSGIRTYQHGFL